MTTMRREGIQEVLTNDHHFTQEGFAVVLTPLPASPPSHPPN
jgi:predicted nucleic acid-binding protein